MNTVRFIVPDSQDTGCGQVVIVPEADAAHFDEIGWARADEKEKPAPKGDQKKK